MANEEKMKHLEFVQAVITRMAQNSFMYKGWAITLLVGIFAVSKDLPASVFLLATLPSLLAFWMLDGFYLWQERLFRKLYVGVVNDTVPLFSMDTRPYASGGKTIGGVDVEAWKSSLFSWSTTWLYIPMLVLATIVGVFKCCGFWE
jgi:hypothetical protein